MTKPLSLTFIILTALIGLQVLAPAQTLNADNLISQPVADYQARRHALMEQIKGIEAKRTEDARAARARFNQQSDLTYVPIVVVFGQDEGDIGEGKYRQK